MIVYIEFQNIWGFQIPTTWNDVMMTSSFFSESVYKTCQWQPTELKLGKLIAHSTFHKICKFKNHVTRNDVIMTSLPKTMEKYGPQRNQKNYISFKRYWWELSKNVLLLNLSHYVKSYRHLCQILVFFTMPTLQIWPCHVTQEANFKKILFFPNFAFNIGKNCKISSTKALYFRSYQPKTSRGGGGWKTPPCAFRVKESLAYSSGESYVILLFRSISDTA